MFAVYDPLNGGYVLKDPLEGWIFTILPSHATEFESQAAALNAIREHYPQSWKRLQIVPVLKEQST